MKGVIQIGAHIAQEYSGWVAEGAENFIFFEPVLASYTKLCEILPKSDNIKTFNLALGNEVGCVVMNTEQVNQGMSSSILEPTLHLRQFPHIKFNSKELVNIDKLDNIKYDRTLYDYICLDVQGFELEVLKGTVNSLDYINEMNIDVHADLYKGGAMIEDIDAFLFPIGFKRVKVDWGKRTWGNAKYIRTIIK